MLYAGSAVDGGDGKDRAATAGQILVDSASLSSAQLATASIARGP